MSIKDWPGGVISNSPVVPAGPYQTDAASGIWTLDQAADYAKQGIWPVAGSVAPMNVDYLLVAGGAGGGGAAGDELDRG